MTKEESFGGENKKQSPHHETHLMPIDGVVEESPRHSCQVEGQADGPITGAIDR